jgi:hypothetical protein
MKKFSLCLLFLAFFVEGVIVDLPFFVFSSIVAFLVFPSFLTLALIFAGSILIDSLLFYPVGFRSFFIFIALLALDLLRG